MRLFFLGREERVTTFSRSYERTKSNKYVQFLLLAVYRFTSEDIFRGSEGCEMGNV